MSAVESALDVLSRAATMVQGQFIPLKFLATRANLRIDRTRRRPEDVSSFSRRLSLDVAAVPSNSFRSALIPRAACDAHGKQKATPLVQQNVLLPEKNRDRRKIQRRETMSPGYRGRKRSSERNIRLYTNSAETTENCRLCGNLLRESFCT